MIYNKHVLDTVAVLQRGFSATPLHRILQYIFNTLYYNNIVSDLTRGLKRPQPI